MIDRVAGRPRQRAGRGAGRLQVVRARADRRLVRLRRRGVGGRVVPAHATARRGRPTRTASSCACWPPRSWRRPGESPERALRRRWSPQHGDPAYARVDAAGRPASRRRSSAALSPDDVTATELAGEPITAKLTEAPGNGATIGGLKVTTESAWFAARPSRHRGRLQDLRRVVPRPRPPGRGAGRGQGGRGRRARRVVTGGRARSTRPGSARGGRLSRATFTRATPARSSTPALDPAYASPSRSSTAAVTWCVGERRPGARRHLDVR